ncbi:MAG: ABC transporter substrate-binding protein, partial [Pseudomonadota bacterium]
MMRVFPAFPHPTLAVCLAIARAALPRTVMMCLLLAAAFAAQTAHADDLLHQHGIAMHGAPAYPPEYTHFSYVNPNAPQGGRLTLAVQGSFDSVNPLVVRGVSARAVRGLVIESLMARSYDEPFTLYGLIAETIAVSEDRSVVEFRLRPEAQFSDGSPIQASDVLFSYELLRENGRPNHRTFYAKVANATIMDERTIR